MANRTLTATMAKNGPVIARQGLNFAYSTFDMLRGVSQGNFSVSNTLVIQMVKLPNNARILDLFVTFTDRADGAFTVGDQSLTNRYVTATSMSASLQTTFLNAAAGAGYKISLSNSSTVTEVKSEPINIFTTNTILSASTTGCIAMGVYYLMDPNAS